MASKSFTVSAVFEGINRIKKPVTRIQNQLQQFTRKTSRNFDNLNKRMSTATSGLKRFGMQAVAVGAAAGGAFAKVATTGANFDQTLRNAAVKFGPEFMDPMSEGFKSLEASAIKWGKTTEFTSSQAAESLLRLGAAGFDAAQATEALPHVLNLASVAQIDLAEAARISSKLIGSFGKEVGQIDEVVSMLAVTANNSATTIEDLFEAFKDGTPSMRLANQEMESIAAITGILGNAGIDATRAGTALKNLGLILGNVSTGKGAKLEKLFRSKGFSLLGEDGKVRQFTDSFRDFNKVMADMTDQQRIALLNDVFGKIPISAANALLEATKSTEKLDNLMEKLQPKNREGLVEGQAAFQRGGVRGSFQSLLASLEAVQIKISKMTEGPLQRLIDKTTAWLDLNADKIALKVRSFVEFLVQHGPQILEVVKWVGGLAAAFMALGTALKAAAVLKTLGALIPIITKLWAVLKVMLVAFAAHPLAAFLIATGLVIANLDTIIMKMRDWLGLNDQLRAAQEQNRQIASLNEAQRSAGIVAAGGEKEFNRFMRMSPEELQNLSASDEASRKRIADSMNEAAANWHKANGKGETNTLVVKAEQGTSVRREGKTGGSNMNLVMGTF